MSSLGVDAISVPAHSGSNIQIGIFRSCVSPRTVTHGLPRPAGIVTSSVRPTSG